jgi:hypothetical protein
LDFGLTKFVIAWMAGFATGDEKSKPHDNRQDDLFRPPLDRSSIRAYPVVTHSH